MFKCGLLTMRQRTVSAGRWFRRPWAMMLLMFLGEAEEAH